MINPEMIHSVKEVAAGWQVFQCRLPADSRVFATRDAASDRARYLNGVEEQYYPVLGRLAQIVDGLRRSHNVGRADAQRLVERALGDIRDSDDATLSAVSSGRLLDGVR